LLHDNVCDGDDLLLGRFEVPCFLSLGPQVLDCIHQLLLLINERLAQFYGPGQVRIHLGDQLRELCNCLYVLVPGLRVDFWYIVRVFHKSGCLHDLERVSGGRQDDRDELVGVQGDGHHELFQFGGALLGRGGRGRRRLDCTWGLSLRVCGSFCRFNVQNQD
jgi:hypothetical protein